VEGGRRAVPPWPTTDEQARSSWSQNVENDDVGTTRISSFPQFVDSAPPVWRRRREDTGGLLRITAGEQVDALHQIVEVEKALAEIPTMPREERAAILGVDDRRVRRPNDVCQTPSGPACPVANLVDDPLEAGHHVRDWWRDSYGPVTDRPEG
jgi:hypothetical protein